MQKVAGERYVYRFVCDPQTLYPFISRHESTSKATPTSTSFVSKPSAITPTNKSSSASTSSSSSSTISSAFNPASIKPAMRLDENYVPFYPSPFYANTFQSSFSPYTPTTPGHVYAPNPIHNNHHVHEMKIPVNNNNNNPYWSRPSFYNSSNHYTLGAFDSHGMISSTPPQTVPHESLENLSSYFPYNATHRLSTLHNECAPNLDFYS